MTIKDVLVYLDNDDDCGNRILTAIDLCKQFNAHLTGLYLMRTLSVRPYPYAYIPGGAFDQFEKDAKDRRDEARLLFKSKTESNGIVGEFMTGNNELIDTIDIQCRYTDLFVIPRMNDNVGYLNSNFDVADILLGSVCPVLVLPEGPLAFKWSKKRVMLAWDGGHECARALRLALPLLSEKDSVDIVSVSSDKTKTNDIALHIARHGIEATVHILKSNSMDVGSVLLDQAKFLKSDFIIMGAYGHSRLRETILGGATKYMLKHASLPILFSH